MSTVDTRSIDELFAAATDWSLHEGEGDVFAVCDLEKIGTREILDRAIALTRSGDPQERRCGASILGQLGWKQGPETFREERLGAILGLMHDGDARVLRSAAVALSHIKDPRGVSALIAHIHHEDEWVRDAVAFALSGRSEPEAIDALIVMMEDPVAIVRDWATMGVGQSGNMDTPAIRAALHRRLDDPEDDVRIEALEGLARCGDLSVVPLLIRRMRAEPENYPLMLPATAFLKIDWKTNRSMTQLIADLERLLRDSA